MSHLNDTIDAALALMPDATDMDIAKFVLHHFPELCDEHRDVLVRTALDALIEEELERRALEGAA